MLPYYKWKMTLKFIVQDDNDAKYTAKLVKEWFVEQKINVLKWSSHSSDLHPIEKLWNIVDKKIRANCNTNKSKMFEITKRENNIQSNLVYAKKDVRMI